MLIPEGAVATPLVFGAEAEYGSDQTVKRHCDERRDERLTAGDLNDSIDTQQYCTESANEHGSKRRKETAHRRHSWFAITEPNPKDDRENKGMEERDPDVEGKLSAVRPGVENP